MRFRRYFRRLILAGALGGAAWAPAALASTVDQIGGQLVPSSQLSIQKANHLVQIGGQLVAPSQLSAWQASQSSPGGAKALPSRLLPADDVAALHGASQIGGYSSSAVPQSYLSKLPADIRSAYLKNQPAQNAATSSSASSSTFDWRDTVIGLVAFVGTCAVLSAAYVTRRRTSLRPV